MLRSSGAIVRRNERFEERCTVYGRSGEVERSIAVDVAPGFQPATRSEMSELVAFVAEDLPGLRTA
jgi:hypothetical protein